MGDLVGSGLTGVAVVFGLIAYEQIKLQVAKRNGRPNGGNCGFTQMDREAIICMKKAAVDTCSAVERMEGVVDGMDDIITRMDERDKTQARVRCPLVKDA